MESTTDKTAALAAARVLVGPTVAALLTDDELGASADRALTWDADYLVPGQDGYVTTYDISWLAADAVELKAAQMAAEGTTKRLVVNGDSIEVTPGNLQNLSLVLRRRSPLYNLVPQASLITVKVPSDLPAYVPTSEG